jgi:hypothetical protein
VVVQCGNYWDCSGGGGSNIDVGPYVTSTFMIVGFGLPAGKTMGACSPNNVFLGRVSGWMVMPFVAFHLRV